VDADPGSQPVPETGFLHVAARYDLGLCGQISDPTSPFERLWKIPPCRKWTKMIDCSGSRTPLRLERFPEVISKLLQESRIPEVTKVRGRPLSSVTRQSRRENGGEVLIILPTALIVLAFT
jgi:hypothetical protein